MHFWHRGHWLKKTPPWFSEKQQPFSCHCKRTRRSGWGVVTFNIIEISLMAVVWARHSMNSTFSHKNTHFCFPCTTNSMRKSRVPASCPNAACTREFPRLWLFLCFELLRDYFCWGKGSPSLQHSHVTHEHSRQLHSFSGSTLMRSNLHSRHLLLYYEFERTLRHPFLPANFSYSAVQMGRPYN